MIDRDRNNPPNAKTDHINKQGMYTNMIKYGINDHAKRAFERPPFYMTVAKMGEHSGTKRQDCDGMLSKTKRESKADE